MILWYNDTINMENKMNPRIPPIFITTSDADRSAPSKPLHSPSPSGGMNPEYDYLFKFRMIGDSGVGKSCLILRYVDETYTENYISTIGVDFKIKTTDIAGKKVKLQIWDTAGEERFRTIESTYAHGAHAIIIAFDLTDRVSFNNVRQWLEEAIQKEGENHIFILVGTKTDLVTKRVVTQEEIKEFVNNHPMISAYIETSSKNNINVDTVFETVAKLVMNKKIGAESVRNAASRPTAASAAKSPSSASTTTPSPGMWSRFTSLFTSAAAPEKSIEISSPVPRTEKPVPYSYSRKEPSTPSTAASSTPKNSTATTAAAAAAAAATTTSSSHSSPYSPAIRSEATTSISSGQPLKTNEHSELNEYSAYFLVYVKSFAGKKTIKERIEELNLSDEEEKRFKKFEDPITLEYMEIPTRLHDTNFDLATIEKLSKNPMNNIPFKRIEIQSDRGLMDELERCIDELQRERKMKLSP